MDEYSSDDNDVAIGDLLVRQEVAMADTHPVVKEDVDNDSDDMDSNDDLRNVPDTREFMPWRDLKPWV